ncbi:MAG TPA: NADH-quinone oxidoreductase subunit N [Flavobacterium sp.]|jgi:NADH-quinone oxidoreductase subunit N
MNTLIAITGLGIIVLILEILNMRKGIVPFAVAGLVGVLALIIAELDLFKSYYGNMVVISRYATTFSALFTILTIFLVALSADFYRNQQSKISDFVSIKIFLLAGAVAMVSFGNLAMFFLGIEILSIALYILAASDRLSLKSNEAGMKYFLMGSFASGIILFGICLIYGATGYFDVAEIHELSKTEAIPAWYFIGITMMIIGMLFKIAAVPFHFWAPDVYEGSPALTTATMSTLAKVVAIAALYKLLTSMNASISNSLEVIIAAVSILSMLLGNLMALRQQNVKRMLAFSGIAHAGYMLMSILALIYVPGILLYYAAAYALAGIAAFAVVLYVGREKGNEDISSFNGLGKSNPFLAAVLTGALLSMGGIPIFSGFFGKFMLFNQAIDGGYLAVVIVAVVSSIISIGYYFKLILAMYTKEAAEDPKPTPFSYYAVGGLAILLNIIIGLFPSLVMDLLG